jgi:hypothetical protein
MKTEITDMTLVDALVVCKGLPEDEIRQIEAFTGGRFDPEEVALSVKNNPTNLKWTCRVIETGEPLVVAGYTPIGPSLWRSFMLANARAWDEYGGEVTLHSRDTLEKLARGNPNIRLETICLAEREQAQRWYKRIGLKYESTLQSYGANGENAVMYVKTLREEN